MKRVLFTLFAAVGVALSGIVAFEYVCDYGEYGPRFYGFPFVQETNASWGGSMSGTVYLLGLAGNVLCWASIIYVVDEAMRASSRSVVKWAMRGFVILAVGLSLLVTPGRAVLNDARYEWHHDQLRIGYFPEVPVCERSLVFFGGQ